MWSDEKITIFNLGTRSQKQIHVAWHQKQLLTNILENFCGIAASCTGSENKQKNVLRK